MEKRLSDEAVASMDLKVSSLDQRITHSEWSITPSC
jgi:hypothetical protein